MLELLAGERQPHESNRALQACNDYLRMSPRRSLRALAHNSSQNQTRFSTLAEWSVKYGWQKRAELYDAQIEAQKNEQRERILSDGLALDYERVVKLKDLAQTLTDEIELNPTNHELIKQLRGVLDDLAKETGGRKVETRHSGAVAVVVQAVDGVSYADL